ncbi:MAG: DNA mismatch repair endonuclease MutL [Oscillospiraceae bacterium]|nr:DNA mismatch repair endonuclease MutL [Oscillospiraceae bacterium]
MGAIKLLAKSVYELIAAGEVIERPSSVVKEMIENSIDAGADNITVEIKNGGRTYIRITDNGCGMSRDDIPLAFVRHATSKISDSDDLLSIATLGFRGEALASICAVSKVDVITKRPEDELGWHYLIEGGVEQSFETSGCPNGTTFIIRDIFYNVPARLKFLKKDVSEGNAIATILQKLALSHPEISFKFIRDNKTEFVTSGDGKLSSAIYAVFGREFSMGVIPVDYSLGSISVKGYVTRPLNSKANRAYQNFFVNSRYVKSVTCMVALEEAYRNQMMTGKFPGCVLMIGINPANIDVNVHPAKIEIRFSEEKSVYDAVYFAVKNSLMNFDTQNKPSNIQPAHKLTSNEVYKQPEPKLSGSQLMFHSPKSEIINDLKDSFMPRKEDEKPNSRIIKTDSLETPADEMPVKENAFTDKTHFPSADDIQRTEAETPLTQVSDRFKYISRSSFEKQSHESITETIVDEVKIKSVKVIGELFKTYIVCECDDEMYLIDKHAAHERYNFEKLKNGTLCVDMQTLLSPVEVLLTFDEYDAIADNIDTCHRLGFGVKILASPKVSLEGVPVLIESDDPADLLVKLADILLSGKNNAGDELFDDLYHSIACKASIKANSFTTKEELEKLVDLIINNDLRYCPHGRPIIVKMTKYEIEKMFKRIV